MGYPEAIGFRAGTSKPYLWYDLLEEKYTALFVHPFCIMDVTCKNYLKLSHELSTEIGATIKQTLEIMGVVFVLYSIMNPYQIPFLGKVGKTPLSIGQKIPNHRKPNYNIRHEHSIY